jgi:hypothetical protein
MQSTSTLTTKLKADVTLSPQEQYTGPSPERETQNEVTKFHCVVLFATLE